MNKKSQKLFLNLTLFELVWYVLCLLMFLWGLTYIVLGLVAKFAPLSSDNNEVLKASNAYAKVFKMGFFEYGLIHVGVAWLLALVVLLLFSKKSDREYEKEQRRAALRASARKSMGVSDEETTVKETVVEAEVVEETKAEEVKEEAVEETKEEVAAEEAKEEVVEEAAAEETKEEVVEEAAVEEVKEEATEDKAE